MKLSIIIPSYQRKEDLSRCLSSIEQADHAETEVIVVDDGSVPPIEIRERYSFPVRLIKQAHLGPGTARNLGAKHASSNIFFFLDDDCTIAPDLIPQCLNIMEDSQIAILGTQILGFEGQNEMERIKNDRSYRTFPRVLMPVDFISGCGYAIRKTAFFRLNGFDPAFLVHEDDDLWLRASEHEIPMFVSLDLKLTHHVRFPRVNDFFNKAQYFSGESDDLLLQKYGKALLLPSPFTSYTTKIRYHYLSRPSVFNLLALTFVSAGKILKTTLRSYYESVWTAGAAWGYLKRYWQELGQRIFDRSILYPFWINHVQFYFRKKPNQLVLFVTNRCQADCVHCFYYDKLNTSRDDLTLEEYDAISRDLEGLEKIYISGGEPFLRDDLPEIVQIFYRWNRLKTLSIPTNGFKTDQTIQTVREILRRCPSLRLNINVSLDGFEETHDRIRKVSGGYRQAIQTLRLLGELKSNYAHLRVGVNVTLMPENQSEYLLFLIHLHKSEPYLDSINADAAYQRMEQGLSKNRSSQIEIPESQWPQFAHVLGGRLNGNIFKAIKDEALLILYREAEKTKKQPVPCKAPRIFNVIRETGDVAFCEQRPYLGNVRKKSLSEILVSKESVQEKKAVQDGVCACSQCFFQEANLFIEPWKPKALRLYSKGLLNLLERTVQ